MARNLCLLIIAIMLLAVAGCKDDSVPTITGRQKVTFPHEVGSLWTYEYTELTITGNVRDTLYDTVDVVVIRDTILANGDSATIWVFRYGHRSPPDTQLVVMAGDTVKLGWDTQFLLGSGTPATIILPIDTSLTWVGGAGYTDTTTVSGPINVSVKGGGFSETYWFLRKWNGLEESEETDIWLAPNVGIVWYRFHFTQQMPQLTETFQLWEMLSYDLP